MDLELTEVQKQIKSSVREFLEKECPKDVVREIVDAEKGYSEALWRKMADLGWMALPIPEEYGGLGGKSPDFVELAVLLEEMGYALLPSPYLSTMILGALPVAAAGTEGQKTSILPHIADGQMKFALALNEQTATFGPEGIETEALADGDGYLLNGKKIFVENGHIADRFVCVARTARTDNPKDGITIFIVDAASPGITISIIPTIGLERVSEIRFQDVWVPEGNVLGKPGTGWEIVEEILHEAAVGRSAEMLGGMEACLFMTNGYAKKRVQYGRTIGSFQTIQHYLSNVWIDIATSRELVYNAASAINSGLPYKSLASMAKCWVGRAFSRTSERCVQMHGAIGTTKEHDISLYFRQAKAWDLSFGNAENHLLRIAEAF